MFLDSPVASNVRIMVLSSSFDSVEYLVGAITLQTSEMSHGIGREHGWEARRHGMGKRVVGIRRELISLMSILPFLERLSYPPFGIRLRVVPQGSARFVSSCSLLSFKGWDKQRSSSIVQRRYPPFSRIFILLILLSPAIFSAPPP